MPPTRAAGLIAAFIFCAQSAAAQNDSARVTHTFSLAAGLAQDDRLDASASPLRFGGHGFDAALAYGRAGARSEFSGWIGGGVRALAPLSSRLLSTEQLISGDVQGTFVRALGARATAARRFALGVDLHASMAFTTHTYSDPEARRSDFAFGLITLGPAISWRQPVPGGSATIDLAVPVASFVARSYADIKAAQPHIGFRAASLTQLRGAGGALTYATRSSARMGLAYIYRWRMLRYDDVQPVRSVSQSLSVALVTRFGARAP